MTKRKADNDENPEGFTLQGKTHRRIRWGSEAGAHGARPGPCPDCGVAKGQLHRPFCDQERCPRCKRGQLISCPCGDDDALPLPERYVAAS